MKHTLDIGICMGKTSKSCLADFLNHVNLVRSPRNFLSNSSQSVLLPKKIAEQKMESLYLKNPLMTGEPPSEDDVSK